MAMRPSWPITHFTQALIAARRGTCPRLKAGIVIVDKFNQVRATGYNGSPSGMDHCTDAGCMMVDGHCLRTLHSEENAIAFATRNRHSLDGCTAYISARPCQKCTKLMIQAGIIEIRFWAPYNTDAVDDQVETLCKHSRVILRGPAATQYPLHVLFDYSDFVGMAGVDPTPEEAAEQWNQLKLASRN